LAVLKFVKIREFLQLLKFIKYEFSNFGARHSKPRSAPITGCWHLANLLVWFGKFHNDCCNRFL